MPAIAEGPLIEPPVREGGQNAILYWAWKPDKVPALRERREDILPRARAFLAETGPRMARPVTRFTPGAASQLLRYGRPGKVRELENAIEHAVVLVRGDRVEVEDLPEEFGRTLPGAYAPGEGRTLGEVARDYFLAVLKADGNNKHLTAKHLGLGMATLYRQLSSYRQT
jgi:DNA-binding NtrC family response regulator